MKKSILIASFFVAALSLSACKKIQAGGNHGTLKLEEGVERYSDDPQSNKEIATKAITSTTDSAKAATEAATIADNAKEVKAEDSAKAGAAEAMKKAASSTSEKK